MIVFQIENKRALQKQMNGEKLQLSIFHHDAWIIKKDDGIRIHYDHSHLLEIPQNSNDIFLESLNGEGTCRIFFSPNDGKTVFYEKYKIPSTLFTIGASIHDDIFLQDARIHESEITIDPIRKEIHSLGLAACNQTIFDHQRYQDGDMIELLNFKMILHEHFIMIRQVENMYVHLPVYEIPQGIQKVVPKKKLLLEKTWNDHLPSETITVEVPPCRNDADIEERSLYFTIGPSLMMALASMCTVMISGYYNQGKDFMDILPSLILPFTMLASTLLWNPLERFKERKAKFKRQKETEEKYAIQINECIEKIQNSKKQWLSEIKTSVNGLQDIQRIAESDEKALLRSSHAETWLCVLIGKRYGIVKVNAVDRSEHESVKLKYAALFEMLNQEIQKDSEMPWVIDLKQYHRIMIADTGWQREMMVSILLQICFSCNSDELGIIFLLDEQWYENEKWLLDIPHTIHQSGIRMTLKKRSEFHDVKKRIERDTKKYILFVSEETPEELSENMISVITLAKGKANAEQKTDLYLEIDSAFGRAVDYKTSESMIFHHDLNQRIEEDLIALIRQLPIAYHFFESPSFFDLYNIDQAELLDIQANWVHAKVRDGIRGILGKDEFGKNIILDLHEKGDGPHGLIAGSTGSGKSELMISFLLSLAVSYSPRELQLVLIDFKGGGAAAVLNEQGHILPHIASSLCNLDLQEMERALISFRNECVEREKLFLKMAKACGHSIMNLDQYQESYQEVYQLPYLPALVIVVDEFAELKAAEPEFLQDLISLSRIGRSLGLHLILSTQKPAGVINDEIWSNCHYKICLRVTKREDSFEVLHSYEAAALNQPGMFILLCKQGLVKGRSGYANQKHGSHECQIRILDHMLKIEKSTPIKGTSSTEASLVLAEIHKYAGDFKGVRCLWQKPLPHILRKRIKESCIAVLDDIYHNCYRRLFLNFKQNPIQTVYTTHNLCKKEFFYSALYEVLHEKSMSDEIYCIDDLKLFAQELISVSSRIIAILESCENEKIQNLFNHIIKENHGRIYLFISDFRSIVDSNPQIQSSFVQIVSHCEQYQTYILFGASAWNDVSGRIASFVKYKYCLKNHSTQDISSILGVSVHMRIQDEHMGIVLKEKPLTFQIIQTNLFDLKQICSWEKNPEQKIYRIPYLPKKVIYESYQGKGIPIGISARSYHWIALKPNETLVIISMYEDEADDLLAVYENHGVLVARLIDGDQSIGQNNARIIWLSLNDFLISKKRQEMEMGLILYVGESYERQFTFRGPLPHLERSQGFFYRRMNCEVIQLVS